jgi:peptidoglycan hydrolase-like amidase
MPRLRRLFFYSFFIFLIVGLVIPRSFWGVPFAQADEIDELQKQIDELGKLKKLSEDATTPLEKEVKTLEQRITSAQAGINQAQIKAKEVAKSIVLREATLGVAYSRFNDKVAAQYRRSRVDTSLVVLASNSSLGDVLRDIEYHERVRAREQEEMSRLTAEIVQFEKDKTTLEATQKKLQTLQASLDSSKQFFQAEISKAKKYQQELSGKIAALSARQQSILAERTGTASTTVGDVPLADDPASRQSYNPGFSPAFAAFSFGAPHFKGMSQYGAYGRAKAGQNAETILHAYYGGGIEIKKDYSTGITINVSGYGSTDIETYVKRIYEMPTSWADNGGFEALKAQAVAARSYALAYTNNGAGSICATESCQVYKPSNKGGRWDEAVDATRGWVLVANGKPFKAWYASTSGGYQQSYSVDGYSTPGFWDTTSDWTRWADGAYEAKGGSPWLYKGWYKSRSGDSCGRSHPWLNESEFADILNAWVVRYKGSGGDVARVQPLGSCWGSEGFSMDEMKRKADELGGAFTSVSSVRVEHGNDGYTKNVIVQTNRGEVRINGAEFKTAFNLRAPGRLAIKGNLFGIEKK